MPSAMSRPREPVEMVSISTASREPSFIALPLPKARSICAKAASRAFCLSILSEFPTTLSEAAMARIPYAVRAAHSTRELPCTSFVPREQEENLIRDRHELWGAGKSCLSLISLHRPENSSPLLFRFPYKYVPESGDFR